MVGAQASKEQFDKIMSYLTIGREEDAKVLASDKQLLGDSFDRGYYV